LYATTVKTWLTSFEYFEYTHNAYYYEKHAERGSIVEKYVIIIVYVFGNTRVARPTAEVDFSLSVLAVLQTVSYKATSRARHATETGSRFLRNSKTRIKSKRSFNIYCPKKTNPRVNTVAPGYPSNTLL